MTAQFARELDKLGVDTDGMHHALRYYLAERLDDQPPEDMLDQMYRVAGRDRVDEALQRLRRNSTLLENGALLVLSAAWSDDTEQDRLRAVLAETKGKLPIVETGIIAITCAYGLYLIITGGLKKSEKTVVRKPDGSFEIHEVKEYTDPARALGAIADLLRPPGARQLTNDSDSSTTSEPDSDKRS